MKIEHQELKIFLEEAGISVPPESQNIGRDISYTKGLKRTVVIHFGKADFPEIVKNTLEAVCSIENAWLWTKRFGEKTATKYDKSSHEPLISRLIEKWHQLNSIGDDIYLISGDGKAFLRFDHHIVEDGMPIYFNDIEKSGLFISKLNRIGAEFEVFSSNG